MLYNLGPMSDNLYKSMILYYFPYILYRYMLGIAGVPSVIQFIGFLWLPESPRWLVEKGREDDARKSLEKIRKTLNVEKELIGIIKAVEDQKTEEHTEGKMIILPYLHLQK